MKRRTTDDERALFEQTFREARPLKVRLSARPARKKAAGAPPAGKPGGLNGATEDRLRRGLIAPQARLDLHGMTEAAAYRALAGFLPVARARGHRLVLVITGKGNPRNGERADWMASPHGVLKEMAPRWLNEPELAALIADVRPAHLRHGGGGALYVYLRKK